MAEPPPGPSQPTNGFSGILILPQSMRLEPPPGAAYSAPAPQPARNFFDDQNLLDELESRQIFPIEFEWDTNSDSDHGSNGMVSLLSLSPLFSFSPLDEAIEEKNRMDEACRAFLQKGRQNGTVDHRIVQNNIITPYSWVKFRQQIIRDGRLQVGNDVLLTMTHGILFKGLGSNMKPICTFPSCFSTNMAPNTEDRRCVHHEGDRTSFCVMELVFKDEVPGRRVTVGIEHVNVMFSHFSTDTPTKLRERILQEYFRNGQSTDTWFRLLQIHFSNAASNFNATKSMTVRRGWTFQDAEKASKHYLTIAMAAELVAKKLNPGQVIPSGEFRGMHLKTVRPPNTVAFEGELFTNMEKRMEICKKINKEQYKNYGMADHVEMIWS